MQKLSNYAILISCGIQPLQAVIAGLLKMTCVRHNHDSGIQALINNNLL